MDGSICDTNKVIEEGGQLVGSLGGGAAGGAIAAYAVTAIFGVATGGVGLVVVGLFVAGSADGAGEGGKALMKMGTDLINQ